MLTVTQPFPPVGVTLGGHPRIAKARGICSPDTSTELPEVELDWDLSPFVLQAPLGFPCSAPG